MSNPPTTKTTTEPRAYAPNVAQQDHADDLWQIACEWTEPIAHRADAAARLVELVDAAGITPRGLQSNVVRSACATVLATAWRRRNIPRAHQAHQHDGMGADD